MKMMLSAILALALHFTPSAQATDINQVFLQINESILSEVQPFIFDFKEGDSTKYDMNVGSFIRGKMEMNVLEVSSEGVWIQQLVDMGFAGKQDMRQLMDPNTGEIKRFIVNGKEQAPPERGNVEVIEQKEDTIQVPAGRYTCVYIKANVEAQGQSTVSEQWIAPREVAVMGLVKMVAQTQLGPMTAVLTSSKKH